MNSKINLDIETAKLIYKKYKEHIVYSSIVAICILVFMIYTLPRILQLASLNEERANEKNKLAILNDNLAFIKSSSDETLNLKLETATSALPENSDFESIINAITLASAKSGAVVSDYGFQVSDLGVPSPISGYPTTRLDLVIGGSDDKLLSFIKNLSQVTPLSEVLSIEKNGNSISLTVVFYFKPSLVGEIAENVKLKGLTAKQEALLSTISSWSMTSVTTSVTENASESASPF